jgi:hypothetical protein
MVESKCESIAYEGLKISDISPKHENLIIDASG